MGREIGYPNPVLAQGPGYDMGRQGFSRFRWNEGNFTGKATVI